MACSPVSLGSWNTTRAPATAGTEALEPWNRAGRLAEAVTVGDGVGDAATPVVVGLDALGALGAQLIAITATRARAGRRANI